MHSSRRFPNGKPVPPPLPEAVWIIPKRRALEMTLVIYSPKCLLLTRTAGRGKTKSRRSDLLIGVASETEEMGPLFQHSSSEGLDLGLLKPQTK